MSRPSSVDRFRLTLRLLRLSSSNGGLSAVAAERRQQAAERVALGRLDLDDLGAPVAEDRRGRRPRHPHPDLDDLDAFHGSGTAAP